MESEKKEFGEKSIGYLLRKQAIPSGIGILMLSIYGIVDTIFVGNYVGSVGIAAITVVIPITFLISSIGMGIGIGGSSIISRALGKGDEDKANRTFGNQLSLTFFLAIFFCCVCWLLLEPILLLFGAKGNILEPTTEYFTILLIGIPALAYSMMSNSVIRAVGYPKVAMTVMIVPAIANIILDPILIVVFDLGLEGAAWATTLSYYFSAGYSISFFLRGKSGFIIGLKEWIPEFKLSKEIFSIGAVTFARQGVISILFLILNNTLFKYGGESAVAIYGIINRMMMLVNVPALGITQGSMPIIGYNYGADSYSRVSKTLKTAIASATIISGVIFSAIMIFTTEIIGIFTDDPALVEDSVPALRITFLMTPLIAFQLISSAYYQAIGKPIPALLLTLTKQGFCLIPLLLILPRIYGLDGVWYSFPIADFLAASICMGYLYYDNRKTVMQKV